MSENEIKLKEAQVRASIREKLVQSGEKQRLKELLAERLSECGWRDNLKENCKNAIKNKGLDKITVEELVAEVTPTGRATVPEKVKAELLQHIKDFLSTQM
mmetsp:Transcript_22602/g.31852  ORF Transcript_22602/g.31852 Transcript_22602/m.31852 type:complete len:101 (-) Transcript_22602:231-533(-)|eukprot:CAMPEP_0175100224 /NCGR_PEP_ID=MMETSP0086_2-20121207/6958_1 /TAXON_ID=136419 /ORGANISM="Unknown Unknown, Strain D1" /LENGTH=100 /DNA_ID=CAMNT_0016374291 /DNA_START=27 /DNA_END=329 /DNA_ORIENTATION=-